MEDDFGYSIFHSGDTQCFSPWIGVANDVYNHHHHHLHHHHHHVPSHELPHDLLMLEDHFFHFASSDLSPSDPLSVWGEGLDAMLLDEVCGFESEMVVDDGNVFDGITQPSFEPEFPAVVGMEDVDGLLNDDEGFIMPSGSPEEEVDDDPKSGVLNCKNLMSERNRRKRLSQQLLALRSLVPNITKMDKRSVLVDALAYLTGVQQETERILAELKDQVGSGGQPFEGYCNPSTLLPSSYPNPSTPQILEIDTEKMEDRRFVVKVTSRGSGSLSGVKVLQVIESLGFDITYTVVEQIKPHHFVTMTFIRLRKHGRMTEAKLKDCIATAAVRSGLTTHRNF